MPDWVSFIGVSPNRECDQEKPGLVFHPFLWGQQMAVAMVTLIKGSLEPVSVSDYFWLKMQS